VPKLPQRRFAGRLTISGCHTHSNCGARSDPRRRSRYNQTMRAPDDEQETLTQPWISLSDTPLDAAAAVAFVTDPRAGGIGVFLGTTRAEPRADGVELVALDYEAYPEMAEAQLRSLGDRAARRWPILKLAVLHRTGRVPLGEPSVVIAVSTPHRAEAFEACRWLIDTLKAEVAVWKKEVWSDGSGSWVEGMTNGQAPMTNQ
jgi:molybdopterin synthase catalytic subunit